MALAVSRSRSTANRCRGGMPEAARICNGQSLTRQRGRVCASNEVELVWHRRSTIGDALCGCL